MACSIVPQRTTLPHVTLKKIKTKQIHTAAVICALCPDVEVSVLNVSWNTRFFVAFHILRNQLFISFDAKYLLKLAQSL
jgi:hypothetical protein